MKRLNLTIIIPCSSDTKIKYCIESIYQHCKDDVEILVSLNNPTKKVKEVLKYFPKVKICEIKEANLSKAYNNGIANASRDNVLIIDSDCIVGENTIQLLYEGLSKALICKGRVIFQYNSLMSQIISKVREYTTTDFVNAYVPPLAFRKDIINFIDGYYFEERMPWCGDGELDYRIKKKEIKLLYIPEAIVYHAPISFCQDIKSAFRYGKGRRIGVDLGLLPKRDYLKLSTHLERFQKTWEVLQKKGFFASLYYFFVWRTVYRLGYFFQGFLNKFFRKL
jgi:glycosyltransferase involved in cell wall biosynthesis